jgi:endonuclease/exonuclease/phosphatase (EEP) superfamily protein YafD
VTAAPLLSVLASLPLLLHRRTRAVPLVLGALALWQSRAALWAPKPSQATHTNCSPLRVVSSNVLYKNRTPRLAAEALMSTNPDVIVLVEVSLAVSLHISKQRYPFELVFSRTDSRGRGYDLRVLSRLPLEHYDDTEAGERFFPLIRVSLNNAHFALVPVHTSAPHKVSDKQYWRSELHGLATSLSSVTGPLVVCGDFNASLAHRPMARLTKTARLSSVLARHGRALRGTWGPRGLVALLPIDHVLVSHDVVSSGISVMRLPGSDHRTLVADLVIPQALTD